MVDFNPVDIVDRVIKADIKPCKYVTGRFRYHWSFLHRDETIVALYLPLYDYFCLLYNLFDSCDYQATLGAIKELS